MKSKVVFTIYIIVVLCGGFLIGCKERETIPYETEQNTELDKELEIETTTSIEDFYRAYKESIDDIDIEEIKLIVNNYYNDVVFIEEIIDIRICETPSEIKGFIGKDYVLGEVVVLEIDAITGGLHDSRVMILNKDITGEWKVTNEGR